MNLLVTGAWKSALECIDAIKYRGHSVVYLQHEQDEVPSKYSWVEGVIGNRIFLTHPIERFTHLKFVQLTGAGYDHIPMSYIKKNNIKIIHRNQRRLIRLNIHKIQKNKKKNFKNNN